MTLQIAASRRRRSRLYQLLAAVHSGPLGYHLGEVLHSLAADAAADPDLPDLPALPEPSHHDAHRAAYRQCPGNPALGCYGHETPLCLVERLGSLSRSAAKGAAKRRLNELREIREQLLPCLETLLRHANDPSVAALVDLTRALVERDALELERLYQS